MRFVPGGIARQAATLGTTAQNVLEVARFGGLETGEEPAEYELAARGRIFRLRHYFPGAAHGKAGPPIVLVPPLMLSAEVWDVSPSASAVRDLHTLGIDPWVIDFGAPEQEEGGLERTLADHVLAVGDAVDHVREATGHDVHLGGYSQGGMFCYQAAAYRRSEGLASVITFGSPVNLRDALPLGIPEEVAVRGVGFIVDQVLRGQAVPGWATRAGFRLLDPVKSLRAQLEFLLQLSDREALLPRESQRRFLMGEGWVAWPGPALAEFMRQFVIHNRMLTGGFTIEDRLVTLADIESPILCFVGEVDEIAPPGSVRPIRHAAPRADIFEIALPAGHFGLVVGGKATRSTWPVVAAWAKRLSSGRGPLPDGVVPMADLDEPDTAGPPRRLGYGAELLAGVGTAAARGVVSSLARSTRTAQQLAKEATVQLPRLARIAPGADDARLSLALVLDEQAKRAPGDVCFLFEDRAFDNAGVKSRVDAVVRGLLEAGVRKGQHVGVLMATRPSALAVIAALNRLGAVAVMLRPGGDTAAEIELGEASLVVADPAHAEQVPDGVPLQRFLLREAGDAGRDGAAGTLELDEREGWSPPGWYRPNPGRARDLAFVFFAGDREKPRANRITNGRWGLSAFGAASSARLSDEDTVYNVNALHHPSGLLTSVGGAIAGGARLAMARSLDPETFWDEARRYGVTVVSYTWAQLRELVEAPPNPGERHHPVRLFMGSGMPFGLWERVTERFAPAGVLEFWAMTEGEAILVNVSGAKRGSLGRPLPGSAEMRIARYDPDAGGPAQDEDGFAIPCEDGEPGLLLARVGARTSATASALRDVFERDDAWVSSDSICMRDEDGDHWLLGSTDTLIRTDAGAIAPLPIVRALEALPAVDLAVAFGRPVGDDGTELAVAAVWLRDGQALSATDVSGALGHLPAEERPRVVRVVDEIPLTAWHRPLAGPLREEQLKPATKRLPAWHRTEGGRYRSLTDAALGRVLTRGRGASARRRRAIAAGG